MDNEKVNVIEILHDIAKTNNLKFDLQEDYNEQLKILNQLKNKESFLRKQINKIIKNINKQKI
jgi:hypothetical protein